MKTSPGFTGFVRDHYEKLILVVVLCLLMVAGLLVIRYIQQDRDSLIRVVLRSN